MKKKPLFRITIYVPDEIGALIQDEALTADRPVSWVVRGKLEAHYMVRQVLEKHGILEKHTAKEEAPSI